MGQFIRIINIGRYFACILPCIVTEHILVTFLAGTQYHNLHFILADLIQHTFDQVKSFLVCQSGYNTDHHYIRIFAQTKLSLKFYLILCFLCCYILCIELVWQMDICLRIENVVINTIDNTGEHIRACLQKLIQLLSVKFCLNLFCISVTDSSYTVCIYDTALEQVHISVSFQLVRCKVAVRNTDNILNNILVIDSLESQVMNGHNCLNILIERVGLERIIQIYRNQCSLPVMAVNDIRTEINGWERAQDSS